MIRKIKKFLKELREYFTLKRKAYDSNEELFLDPIEKYYYHTFSVPATYYKHFVQPLSIDSLIEGGYFEAAKNIWVNYEGHIVRVIQSKYCNLTEDKEIVVEWEIYSDSHIDIDVDWHVPANTYQLIDGFSVPFYLDLSLHTDPEYLDKLNEFQTLVANYMINHSTGVLRINAASAIDVVKALGQLSAVLYCPGEFNLREKQEFPPIAVVRDLIFAEIYLDYPGIVIVVSEGVMPLDSSLMPLLNNDGTMSFDDYRLVTENTDTDVDNEIITAISSPSGTFDNRDKPTARWHEGLSKESSKSWDGDSRRQSPVRDNEGNSND